MKATELRLGNYYSYSGNRKKRKGICRIDIKDLEILLKNPKNHNYRPLIIGEKWLLKFGFYKTKKLSRYWHPGRLSNFSIRYLNGRFTFFVYAWSSHCPFAEVEYVHQLQNLYFELTGSELQ